jgi:hypothetical protein
VMNYLDVYGNISLHCVNYSMMEPVSGLEEGRTQGVDLVAGGMSPEELIENMPPVSWSLAKHTLEFAL